MPKAAQKKWTEEDFRILGECKTLKEAEERLGRSWASISTKQYQLGRGHFPDYRVYRAHYREERKEKLRAAKSNAV